MNMFNMMQPDMNQFSRNNRNHRYLKSACTALRQTNLSQLFYALYEIDEKSKLR